ncbi:MULTISPECIES: AraC family transcriptional regulator [Brevibacterium]|uniref:AraC family transcriptional regulator n=1 Tax=Brevibacterium casei TaxID=33889 RepID=A0A7T4DJZ5_9MICO|nr:MULTISPECIES: AraC family transcriptional regulator [Brevibacterium]QQB15398.1 AraC family transcriptional regulator [Brevibacterium casei]
MDEFERDVGRSLSPHRLLGVDQRAFEPEVWKLDLERLRFVQFSLGTEVDVDVPEHEDYLGFLIARRGGARVDIGSESVAVTPAASAAILVPGARVRMNLRPDYDQLHLRVDAAVLRAHAETLLGRAAPAAPRFRTHTFRLGAGFGAWLGTLEGLVSEGRAGADMSPLMTKSLEDMLLTQLVLGHPDLGAGEPETMDAHPAGPATTKRVRLALDHIADHLGEPLTVTGIAEAAGLSVRTLQRAFREQLGVSPLAHVQKERLHAARTDILGSDTAISDIAFRWGFSHPSRFAAAYARLFGERPSQTRAMR